MSEHGVIYLAPQCCASPYEGRMWCEDDVWPCNDCPHQLNEKRPHGIRYKLDDERLPKWTQEEIDEVKRKGAELHAAIKWE